MVHDSERETTAVYLGRVLTVFVEKSPDKNHCPAAYSGFFRKGSFRIRVFIVGLTRNPGPTFTGRVCGMIYNVKNDSAGYKRPEAMVLAPTSQKLNQAEIAERIFTKEENNKHTDCAIMCAGLADGADQGSKTTNHEKTKKQKGYLL